MGRIYNPNCIDCGGVKKPHTSYCPECNRRRGREAYHRKRRLGGGSRVAPVVTPPLSWQEFEAMQEAPERWQRGGRETSEIPK